MCEHNLSVHSGAGLHRKRAFKTSGPLVYNPIGMSHVVRTHIAQTFIQMLSFPNSRLKNGVILHTASLKEDEKSNNYSYYGNAPYLLPCTRPT